MLRSCARLPQEDESKITNEIDGLGMANTLIHERFKECLKYISIGHLASEYSRHIAGHYDFSMFYNFPLSRRKPNANKCF